MNHPSIIITVLVGLLVLFEQRTAQAEADSWSMGGDKLLSQVPPDFFGALIVCDPFCEIISVKLENQWKPPLESIRVTSTRIQLLSKNDPLFTELYPPEVVPPPTMDETNELSNNNQKPTSHDEESTMEEGILVDERDEKDPKFPKVSFENGWRIPLRLQSESVAHQTDSPIQADFKPARALYSTTIGLDYFRAKPVWFLKLWWQFELGLSSTNTKGRSPLINGQSLTTNEKITYGILWNKLRRYRWGVRYLSQYKQFSLSREMISEFSFSEKIDFLGLALHFRRFQLFFDYGLGLNLKEQQKYRGELLNFTGKKISGRFCQTKRRLLGLETTPCYFLSYFSTSNSGKLVSELSSTNTVTLERQEVGFAVELNFGEDFLR